MDKPALRRTDRMLRSTSSSPACPERRRRDPLSGVVPTGTKTDRPFGPLRSRRQDGHLNERLPPLKIEPAEIPDVLLVTPHVFKDDRGFFMETWHERKFREQGLDLRFVQDNHSKSRRGTLRGLHFQNPHPQGKLVRVVVGAVYDVAVDIRRGSPTFAKWVGAELSAENKLSLYVPPGFAHGFCVLSDAAEFVYKCADFYAPEHEHGIIWNDPQIAIQWPIADPILSEKDAGYPTLAECEEALPDFPARERT